MGVVWRGRDTKLDRDVAIEILPVLARAVLYGRRSGPVSSAVNSGRTIFL